MRCVLDPNVLVSALLSRGGTPAQLVRLWLEGAFELIVSPLLISELKRVLAYPKIRSKVSEAESDAFLELLNEAASMVADPGRAPSLGSSDPEDDYLVALAEDARAVIVSGDKHLLNLAGQLPVFPPAGFRQMLWEVENRNGRN